MKKTLTVTLVLALLVCFAAGCSPTSQNTATSAPPSTSVNQSTQTPAAAEPTVITITMKDNDAAKVTDTQPIRKQIEEKFGIKLDLVTAYDQDSLKDVYTLAISSGNTPDIMWGFGDSTFTSYDSFIQQGVLAEVTIDTVKQNAPKYYDWVVSNGGGENVWKIYERNGKNYSLPIFWTLGPNYRVIGYRSEFFEAAGYGDMPTDIANLEIALTAVKEMYNIAPVTSADPLEGLSFVYGAFGVYPTIFHEKDGELVYGGVSPEAKEALTVLNRWYQNGLLDPEFMINKSDNALEKWSNGNAVMLAGAWWDFLPAEAFFSGTFYACFQNGENEDVKIYKAPTGPNGDSGCQQINPVIDSGLLFGKQLEGTPTIAKVLELIDACCFDREMLDYCYYGVENETYTYDDETGVNWLPPYDDATKREEYGIGVYAVLPDCFNDYTLQAKYMTQPKYLDMRTDAESKGEGKYDIMAPINRPVFNEKKEVLEKIVIDNHIDFITGARSLDEFDTFVSEWLAAGGEEVMAESVEKYAAIK